jgi:hypothetical protein
MLRYVILLPTAGALGGRREEAPRWRLPSCKVFRNMGTKRENRKVPVSATVATHVPRAERENNALFTLGLSRGDADTYTKAGR